MRGEILGRWQFDIERNPGPLPPGTEGWFGEFAMRKPGHVSRSATSNYWIVEAVKDQPVRSVYEAFGGLGVQSLLLHDAFDLEEHIAVENDPAAVAHLERLLPEMRVVYGDAYALPVPSVDLVTFDGPWTIQRVAQGFAKPLFEATIATRPQVILVTDVSPARVHLHKRTYGAILGAEPNSVAQYFHLLALWYKREYGYGAVAGYWHSLAGRLALVRDAAVDLPAILRNPSQPVGFRWLQ